MDATPGLLHASDDGATLAIRYDRVTAVQHLQWTQRQQPVPPAIQLTALHGQPMGLGCTQPASEIVQALPIDLDSALR